MVQAVRLIRENSYKNVNVCKLLESIPISQTSLYRRFKHHLGRTPKEEMTRVRLERAKQLLAETSLPIQSIAERIGFNNQQPTTIVSLACDGAFQRTSAIGIRQGGYAGKCVLVGVERIFISCRVAKCVGRSDRPVEVVILRVKHWRV